MLDIKFIRENPELVQKASKDKKVEVDIAHILEIDKKRQQLNVAVQNLQQHRNSFAKNIKGKPTDEQLEELEKTYDDMKNEYIDVGNKSSEEIIDMVKRLKNE